MMKSRNSLIDGYLLYKLSLLTSLRLTFSDLQNSFFIFSKFFEVCPDLGTSIALDILDVVIAGPRLSMAMAISSPVDFFLKHQ